MESSKDTSKSFTSTVNADNFFEYLENGYLKNILRSNPLALESWTLGIDTPTRPQPQIHEITIPGSPAIPAIPAILADPAQGILGVAAVAANRLRSKIKPTFRFDFPE